MSSKRNEKWLIVFGEHFQLIRRRMNFTQKELAFEANVEISQISRIERGKINPTVTSLLIYAKAMNISAKVFFEFDLAEQTKVKK
jgi:transcriptional regulator with XRE-family HTH domain